jgi:hypothetical protein
MAPVFQGAFDLGVTSSPIGFIRPTFARAPLRPDGHDSGIVE